ncbi:MAG TPA: hypothetical protein VNO22_03230 [Planctomycetota bacterium]|nr:hypothetical protein [Planctomycetota bacterium]
MRQAPAQETLEADGTPLWPATAHDVDGPDKEVGNPDAPRTPRVSSGACLSPAGLPARSVFVRAVLPLLLALGCRSAPDPWR